MRTIRSYVADLLRDCDEQYASWERDLAHQRYEQRLRIAIERNLIEHDKAIAAYRDAQRRRFETKQRPTL